MPSFQTAQALISAYTHVSQARLDPYMAYNFAVEIGGLIVGGFSEVAGLSSEVSTETYQEGGVNGYVHQFPSQVTYPNLILSKGLSASEVLWNWYTLTTQGRPLLLNGTLLLLNDQQLPVMWWNFKDAYPVKWQGPQFNASNADQVSIEQIELVHRGIVKPVASQALSTALSTTLSAASIAGGLT